MSSRSKHYTVRRGRLGGEGNADDFESFDLNQLISTEAFFPLRPLGEPPPYTGEVYCRSFAGALYGVDGGRGAQRRVMSARCLTSAPSTSINHVEEIHRAVDDAQFGDVPRGGRSPSTGSTGCPAG